MMKMASMRTSKSPSAIEKVAYALSKADVFLDLNGTNRPYYEANIEQETKAQIHFGPYIFPCKVFYHKPHNQEKLVFFGRQESQRHPKHLAEIKNSIVDILSQNCYLEPLYKEINVSSGVLNLHFEEGIYSEIPRLLSAYICGKVLYSEPLAAPFISGQYYIPLGSKVTFNTEEIYTNISKTFVQNFSFSQFLTEQAV